MTPNQLNAVLRELGATTVHTTTQLREFLQLVRELRAVLPEAVAKYGSKLLRLSSRSITPDELWTLREEVAVALLQVGRADAAWVLVQAADRRFPDSTRASRLMGMYFEATGRQAQAEALCTKELQRDPQNAMMLRRMASMKKGEGDLTGAAKALRAYLSIHQADWLAWEEAGAVYLRLGALSQAIFCLEEVLLHQGGNVGIQLLLADALYTAGGVANWRSARGYYSAILEVSQGGSVRALYGVCACAGQLEGGKQRGVISRQSGMDTSHDDDGGLPEAAAQALVVKYGGLCERKLPVLKAMLKAQRLL